MEAGWVKEGNDWVWYGDNNVPVDYNFGKYDNLGNSIDQIVYSAPYYTIVWAAGNSRGKGPQPYASHKHKNDPNGTYIDLHYKNGGDTGFDCIPHEGLAKNIITVGAVDDLPNGYQGVSSVVQQNTSFSSWGPTDDGRIKPDIVANGDGLYSTVYHQEMDATKPTGNYYYSDNGTSMAAPNVTGSLSLLQQHYKNTHNQNYPKAATLKALVIHSADEAGSYSGPDFKYGWGLMNTNKAAEVISLDVNVSNSIQELTLQNGQTYLLDVTPYGNEPLKVTIAWADPPSSNPLTQVLVNDLDLRIIKGSTFYPWHLDWSNPSAAPTNADNNRDNVEQIVIDNPIAGQTYRIQVSHKGTLSNPQDFSMVITGITPPNTILIKQVDKNNNSFGTFGVWVASWPGWNYWSSPQVFAKDMTSITLKAQQDFIQGTYQKYANWQNNLGNRNYLNFGTLSVTTSTSEIKAQFDETYNITVQNAVEGVATLNGGTIEFKDPWLTDYNQSPYGMRNQGTSASFKSRASPFSPDYATSYSGDVYKGIFLNQDPAQTPTYYSVRAQSTQTINGYTSYFQNWGTTGANVQYSTTLETPVVLTSANAVVTANYKGHLISNATTGFSSNSQRKVVRTDDGKLHLVYESMNQVWYTYSTDGGSTWLQEQKVDYLGANCKSASIAQSNDGLNKVYIVYQRDAVAGDNPKIILDEFQNGVRTWNFNADVYTLSSYSYDTKPVVAALNNTVCVVFKPSSTSALRDKNFYYNGSWIAQSDFQLYNTTSNSSNPSIASDVQKFFLAYQNGATEIKYLEFIRGVDNVFFAYEESIITTGSPYTNNIEPSISSHEGDPLISWSGYSGSIPTAVVKRRVSGTWSNFNSFGSGSVRNTNNSSRDAGTDGSIIAWSNIYYEHKCVKLLNGVYSSITTIPETGGNGQIQLSNGYDFNNIKSVVQKQPLSGIYEVKPLPFNFSILQKVSGNTLRYYGRMAINRKQEKTFVYYLGSILLDGKSIMFKHVQDTANIKTDDNMTEIMATENIYLRPQSSLQLSTSYYVIDRDNTKKLVNGEEIKFSVELVDANSKEVKTSFDEAKYDSKSSPEKKSSYTLNLKNINEGNYFLRISAKTSGCGEFYYCDVQDEETSNLKKEEQVELEFKNNKIPTGYELLQNHPNPFNPTTTINYQMPENGFVTIKVYDMLGKEIATLVNGNRTAGYHKVTFDASRLTSGVYVYTINAGNYTQSRKMLLTK